MSKNIVMNIEPFDIESRAYENGFTLTFRAPIKKGDYSAHKIINIKMDRWWLSYVSREVKDCLEWHKAEIKRLEELCGFES